MGIDSGAPSFALSSEGWESTNLTRGEQSARVPRPSLLGRESTNFIQMCPADR